MSKKEINNKELRKFMDKMIVGDWTSKSTIQFSENARQAICNIIERAKFNEFHPIEDYADEILKMLEAELNEGKIPEL